MAEGLGEVAQELSAGGVDLLGEQADIVDEGDGPFENGAGPSRLAGQGQGLSQPEGAQQERAFVTLERSRGSGSGTPVPRSSMRRSSVASIVASTLGSSAGRNPTRGSIRLEASRSSEPKDWVKALARSLQPLVMIASWIWSWVCFHASTRSEASRRSARATARSSATQHISLEYRKSRGSPRTSQIPWSFSCQRWAAVSASWTRKRLVAGARSGGAPHLSGAASGPTRREAVEEVVGEAVDGAEQFAVDVELALAPGAVADPNRGGVSPARQVGQLPLGQVPFAADAEHDLQVAAPVERAGRRGGHVLEELVGLVRAGRDPQGLDGEGGVPDPGVAVVPVSGAAHRLRQRGGRRCADRAGGLKGQRLEHPSAVVDQIPPRAHIGLVELGPRLPRRHGVFQSGADLGLAPHLG